MLKKYRCKRRNYFSEKEIEGAFEMLDSWKVSREGAVVVKYSK
jgi:hypothetical protein